MNRKEAKYILRGFHVGGHDANDSQFQEALQLLSLDRELADWFARERALDATLSEKIRSFPVPGDLKSQLLAARSVASQRRWWRRPTWLSAAAACLSILAVVTTLLTNRPAKAPFSEYHAYIGQTTARLDHLDLRTSDLARIRQWLESHGGPGDFVIPHHVAGKPSLGCRVFRWNGHEISLICFELETGKVAHMFVMEGASLRGGPAGKVPWFQTTAEGLATASWSDSHGIYILAMRQGGPDLKDLFL